MPRTSLLIHLICSRACFRRAREYGSSFELQLSRNGPEIQPQSPLLKHCCVEHNRLPRIEDILLTSVIGITLVFEIAEPIMMQFAPRRVGEDDPGRT